MEGNLKVVSEIQEDSILIARLYENGVVEIEWNEKIEDIEVHHLQKMQEVVGEIGRGERMPLYYSTHEFLGITKEARKFAVTKEGTKHTLIIAVLVNNLAMQLLFNFFMRVNRPKIPTKGFRNKEDAFQWLDKKGKKIQTIK
ncbi:MAG: hypothetical protein KDC84_10895 [Crocinitomicaceae bacterium]|nr:hypothetical protein [Crocinitomicaceae bacterium]